MERGSDGLTELVQQNSGLIHKSEHEPIQVDLEAACIKTATALLNAGAGPEHR